MAKRRRKFKINKGDLIVFTKARERYHPQTGRVYRVLWFSTTRSHDGKTYPEVCVEDLETKRRLQCVGFYMKKVTPLEAIALQADDR